MSKTSKNAQQRSPRGTEERQSRLHFLAYVAITVPVVAAAFVAGIVFERQRVQTSRLQVPGVTSGGPADIASKTDQDPAPYQAATAPKEQQHPAPEAKEAARQEKITQAMRAIAA